MKEQGVRNPLSLPRRTLHLNGGLPAPGADASADVLVVALPLKGQKSALRTRQRPRRAE